MLTIDKHVPVPPLTSGRGSPKQYPLREMAVGDSFTVPLPRRSAVATAMHKAAERYGRTYTSRREGDHVRVWRVT